MEIAKLTHKFTQCDLTILARTAGYKAIKKFMTSKSFKKIGEKYVGC
jgi:SpoVK/Ycf46/Vps4 family AAA+-type ATPase